MSRINVTIIHHLSPDEALKRIQDLFVNFKKEYGRQLRDPEEMWSEKKCIFSFQIQGFEISGELEVTPCEITINAKLPLIAAPFKGQIQDKIYLKVKELLS